MSRIGLGIALALALFIPAFSFAQTNNCTVTSNLFSEGVPFLNISAPDGCVRPNQNPANVTITKSGSYTCVSGATYSDVNIVVGLDKVGFNAKCPLYPYGVKSSSFKVTVKFGASSGGGDDGTHIGGYYCNRTDPVKPFCDLATTGTDQLSSAQCLASCQPSRDWVDINIDPEKNKYQTGQIIKFLPQSNIISRLANFSWNFDDQIKRANEPYREQPVVYTTPGKKNITLSVVDPQTNKTIATTTQIKVKCVPPANAVEGPITVFSYLYNYHPVNIAADNFRQWTEDNYEEVVDWLTDTQTCFIRSVKDIKSSDQANLVIDYLNKYLRDNNPVPMFLVADSLGGHNIVTLDFQKTNNESGSRALYSMKILDSNDLQVKDIRCYQSQITSQQSPNIPPGVFFKILTCDLPINVDGITTLHNMTLLSSIDASGFFGLDKLIANRVRSNPANYLTKAKNYPSIPNFAPEGTQGVCVAWSKLALNEAYLANFVGECNTTPTAQVPGQIASLGLLNFLESIFNQLLKPFLQQP